LKVDDSLKIEKSKNPACGLREGAVDTRLTSPAGATLVKSTDAYNLLPFIVVSPLRGLVAGVFRTAGSGRIRPHTDGYHYVTPSAFI